MLPFKTIYVDSSIFIDEGWTNISSLLKGVISLSKNARVSIVLLEPVERELEAHWMRDWDKTLQRLDASLLRVNV